MVYSHTWRFTRLAVCSLLLGSPAVSATAASTTSYSAAGPSNSSSPSSTSSRPITHTVDVALGGFTFTPDVVLADVGDLIQYNFFPTNHSVVRAQYKYPCIPYEDTGVDLVGFFSGFKPVDAILSVPPTFTIRVNDTNPIFYYCSAPGSCVTHGMVGVINPNASTSLALQKQLAENSTFMLQPGEPWPSESTPDPFSGGAAASTPTSTSSSSSSSSPTQTAAAATSSAAVAASHSSGLSGGAIAGIAIGAAAVAILAAALSYMCGIQSRRDRRQSVATMSQPAYRDPRASEMSGNPNASQQTTMVSRKSSSPYTSPALPGYISRRDTLNVPESPYYAPSDALSPASDAGDGRSPSPGKMMRGIGMPPYTNLAQHEAAQQSDINIDTTPNGHHGQVHEMAAWQDQDGGIMAYIRASMRKSGGASGGVERYG